MSDVVTTTRSCLRGRVGTFGVSITSDRMTGAVAAPATYRFRGYDAAAGVYVFGSSASPSTPPTTWTPAATGTITRIRQIGGE